MEDSAGPVAPEALAADLGTALERVVALMRSLNTAHVISRTASGTLAALERWGPTRLTALAVREGVSQPAMTQLISRLESAGLVSREADPSDGRVVRVTITEAGRGMIALRRAERTGRLIEILDQLAPEHRAALAAAIPALHALTSSPVSQPVPG